MICFAWSKNYSILKPTFKIKPFIIKTEPFNVFIFFLACIFITKTLSYDAKSLKWCTSTYMIDDILLAIIEKKFPASSNNLSIFFHRYESCKNPHFIDKNMTDHVQNYRFKFFENWILLILSCYILSILLCCLIQSFYLLYMTFH